MSKHAEFIEFHRQFDRGYLGESYVEINETENGPVLSLLCPVADAARKEGQSLITEQYRITDAMGLETDGYDLFFEGKWQGRYPTDAEAQAAAVALSQPDTALTMRSL